MPSKCAPVLNEHLAHTSIISIIILPKHAQDPFVYHLSSSNYKILFRSHSSGVLALFFVQIACMDFSCLKIN